MRSIISLPRLIAISGLTLCLATLPTLAEPKKKGRQVPAEFQQMLTACVEDKCSVVVYVGGQNIPIIVTAVDSQTVTGRNRNHDRVSIRLDRIDAIAR